jgi:LPS sulfotransferase NodH
MTGESPQSRALAGLYGAAWDFPPAEKPLLDYAICFAPRTGSNLLAHALWRTGCFGSPLEYFNYDSKWMVPVMGRLGVVSVSEYLDRLREVRTSPNGVFGTKLLPGHWQMLAHSRRSGFTAGARLIMTGRRDRIAQAISQSIAVQTGEWRRGDLSTMNAEYEFQSILDALIYHDQVYRFWSAQLQQTQRQGLMIVYENLIADPERSVRQVADYLGVAIDSAALIADLPPVEKQATSRNAEWRERFLAEAKQKDVMLKGYTD